MSWGGGGRNAARGRDRERERRILTCRGWGTAGGPWRGVWGAGLRKERHTITQKWVLGEERRMERKRDEGVKEAIR